MSLCGRNPGKARTVVLADPVTLMFWADCQACNGIYYLPDLQRKKLIKQGYVHVLVGYTTGHKCFAFKCMYLIPTAKNIDTHDTVIFARLHSSSFSQTKRLTQQFLNLAGVPKLKLQKLDWSILLQCYGPQR